MRAIPYEHDHLLPLLDLVNGHLAAVVPGWALTAEFLAEHLQRNVGEYVTDPWVVERATLCVLEGHRMLAAAHLLRYEEDPGVAAALRGVGEISWLVFLPDRADAATAVLSAVHGMLASWPVTRRQAYGSGLPKMPLAGIPDAWPHVARALGATGYEPARKGNREALYGGRLDGIPTPDEPPVPGTTISRSVGRLGVRFSALQGEEELGICECVADLGRGGALPALRGWADLSEVRVAEGWRNRGVGSWLVGTAAEWLRHGRCERVILVVDGEDEAAGRFYRRFGWEVLAREVLPGSRRRA